MPHPFDPSRWQNRAFTHRPGSSNPANGSRPSLSKRQLKKQRQRANKEAHSGGDAEDEEPELDEERRPASRTSENGSPPGNFFFQEDEEMLDASIGPEGENGTPVADAEDEPYDMYELAQRVIGAALEAAFDEGAPIEPEEASVDEPIAPAEIPVDETIPETAESGDGVDMAEDEDGWEDDGSKPVKHDRLKGEMSLLELALAIWAEKHRIPRPAWSALLEIFPLLLKSPKDVESLPKGVSHLKNRLKRYLPLVARRHKALEVLQLKLPSMSNTERRKGASNRKADMHWIEPAPLLSLLLSSKRWTKTVWRDFGVFVDNPEHLWESESWQNSVRTTSGNFAHYRDGSPILPSDFVKYKPSTEEGEERAIGRIYGVGIDQRSQSPHKGKVVIRMQKIVQKESLRDILPHMSMFRPLRTPLHPGELLLCEDSFDWVTPEAVFSRIDGLSMDYKFESDMGSKDYLPNPTFNRSKWIRRVLNIERGEIRPAVESHPHIAELELDEYGRAYYLEQAEKGFISMPYLMFIDAFGLYRNMFRSLLGIYITFGGQKIRHRMQRANNFAIALGPHGGNLDDVISSIIGLPELDKGMKLMINGKETMVMAFPLCYTGDMPQQNDNCGILRQSATRGCRSCLVEAKDRGDLEYDTVKFGRYHYHHKNIRSHAEGMSVSERKAWFSEWGMRPEEPALCRVSPALDIFNTRPADVCHSEYAGQGVASHLLLMEAILTESAPLRSPAGTLSGKDRYHHEFIRIPARPGWGKRQSPRHHMKSWGMSEAAMATVITPLVFKSMPLERVDIQPAFWDAVEADRTFAEEMVKNGWDVADVITYCYCAIAWSTALICCPKLTLSQRVSAGEVVAAGRSFYCGLVRCAASAAEGKRRRWADQRRRNADSQNESEEDDDASQSSIASSVMAQNDDDRITSEYRSWGARPNVHQGLHLTSIMQRFGTAYNCNVLAGEDKHRFFKDLARNINGQSPERDLMATECVHLTLRLLLNGSFDHTEPILGAQIRDLRRLCPTLTSHFTSKFERDEAPDEAELDLPGDEKHKKAKASRFSDRGFVKNVLKLPLSLDKLDTSHELVRGIRNAYNIHYHDPHITRLGAEPLWWYSRLSFTDSDEKRRVTMNTGDCYISDDGSMHRFEIGFVHQRKKGERKFFAIVSEMADAAKVDGVMGLQLLSAVSQKIVGLSEIGWKQEYVLDLKYKEHLETVAQIDAKFRATAQTGAALPPHFPTLLHCPWEVGIM